MHFKLNVSCALFIAAHPSLIMVCWYVVSCIFVYLVYIVLSPHHLLPHYNTYSLTTCCLNIVGDSVCVVGACVT